MRLSIKMYPRVGILTDCPSAAPFGFALGPPNPWLNTIAKETLDFRCAGLSPAMRLLRPTFSLLSAPPSFTLRLQCPQNASLPLPLLATARRFIIELRICYEFTNSYIRIDSLFVDELRTKVRSSNPCLRY